MNDAAQRLVGLHDYVAFCRWREGASTIRTVQQFGVQRADDLLTCTIRADAFCHNMVRALVGSMLLVGGGQRPLDFPREVLAGGVRNSAVNVVRPYGLTLEEVGYPADELLAERNRAARRLRVLGGQ